MPSVCCGDDDDNSGSYYGTHDGIAKLPRVNEYQWHRLARALTGVTRLYMDTNNLPALHVHSYSGMRF